MSSLRAWGLVACVWWSSACGDTPGSSDAGGGNDATALVDAALADAEPALADAEPAHEDAEPAHEDAEPMQPDAEPVQPDAEPMQQDADPAQPDAEPAPPDAEPTPPDAEPAQPDAEPAQPDAEPTQPDAEPAQPDAEPAQPDAAPAQPDAEPAQPDAAPTFPDATAPDLGAPDAGLADATSPDASVTLPVRFVLDTLVPRAPSRSGAVADIDGDGRLDAVVADATGVHVYFDDPGAWPRVTLAAGDPYDVAAADMDLDGDIDVVAAGVAGASWLVNPGTGRAGAPWASENIYSGRDTFILGDVSGDGRPEVVAFGSVFMRTANGTWARSFSGVASQRALAIADLDLDGRLEVVLGNRELYRHVVTRSSGGVSVSMNGAFLHGAPDILAYEPGVLAQADGDPELELFIPVKDGATARLLRIDPGPNAPTVTTHFLRSGTARARFRTLASIELDGDPQRELLVEGIQVEGAANDTLVVEAGASAAGATLRALGEAWPNAAIRAYRPADLDLDGDQDVLVITDRAIVCLRAVAPGTDAGVGAPDAGTGAADAGTGAADAGPSAPGSFGQHFPPTGQIWAPEQVAVADFASVASGESVQVHQGTVVMVEAPARVTRFPWTADLEYVTADLDADGDPDLLARSGGAPRVLWYENGGYTGQLDDVQFMQHLVAAFPQAPHAVAAADLTGDGMADVVSRSSQGIALHRRVSGSWQTSALDPTATAGRVVLADADADGIPDVSFDVAVACPLAAGCVGLRTGLAARGGGSATLGASAPVALVPALEPFRRIGPFATGQADGDPELEVFVVAEPASTSTTTTAVLVRLDASPAGWIAQPVFRIAGGTFISLTLANYDGDPEDEVLVGATDPAWSGPGTGLRAWILGLPGTPSLDSSTWGLVPLASRLGAGDWNRDGRLDVYTWGPGLDAFRIFLNAP